MKELIGVIHLKPLPGSYGNREKFDDILNFALHDAENLLKGGIKKAIVENFGDAPFQCGSVDPHTIAFITHAIIRIKENFPELTLGVNVLRNDGKAAVGIAAATGAQFVRINVLTYAMVTDCGLVNGQANEVMTYKKILNPQIKVYADVLVKHAFPVSEYDPVQVAKDTAERGGADAVIVTGGSTGEEVDVDTIMAIKSKTKNIRVFVGSGVRPDNIKIYLKYADGFIVGTSIKKYGLVDNPVDPVKVRTLVELISSKGEIDL